MMKRLYNQSHRKQQQQAAYAFVLPAVLLLFTFLILPAFSTIGYSLTDYNIMRPDKISFVALENFRELIHDENFRKALRNIIHFTVFVVPYQCLLALALALLTNVKLKGASVFRAAYFSPMVTSMVVIAILWSVLYNPNPNQGLINAFLTSFGIGPAAFLTSPKTAMNSIVFMSGWQAAGYQMMIFVAGLQGIPQDQYEAASIDGAGKSGYETLYPALCDDSGRAAECNKDVCVLYLPARLPIQKFWVCMCGSSCVFPDCCNHVIFTETYHQGKLREGNL